MEYLPQLGRPFQEMLALADDLSDGLHRLEAKGHTPARELISRRKEIRHLISEIVHKTDRDNRVERIQRVLELGAALKQQISAEGQK